MRNDAESIHGLLGIQKQLRSLGGKVHATPGTNNLLYAKHVRPEIVICKHSMDY